MRTITFKKKRLAKKYMGKLTRKFFSKYKQGLNFKISTDGCTLTYSILS